MSIDINYLKEEKYILQDLKKSAVIVHPDSIAKYGIELSDVGFVFEEGSNFTRLENPIVDEYGNKYYDSEAYYMAQRLENPDAKTMVSICSIKPNFSKDAAYLLENQLETDIQKRIEYMVKAVEKKYRNNEKLCEILLSTWDKQIIELTHWWDTLFWISHVNLCWCNILWKIHMIVRDKIRNTKK